MHGQRNDASAASRTGAPRFGSAQREEGGPLYGAAAVAVLGQVEEAAYGQVYVVYPCMDLQLWTTCCPDAYLCELHGRSAPPVAASSNATRIEGMECTDIAEV